MLVGDRNIWLGLDLIKVSCEPGLVGASIMVCADRPGETQSHNLQPYNNDCWKRQIIFFNLFIFSTLIIFRNYFYF